MPDRIELRGLSAFGRHGVLQFEKEIPQPFVLDISLEVDLLPAGTSDDLAQSLSYADVAARVLEVCSGEPVDLIETLAERVAQACFEWPTVEAVDVVVRKPHAPAGVAFVSTDGIAGPAVSIRRERSRECVVALGANLGRRVALLGSALEALRALEGFDVVHVSPIVETDPVGGVAQPDFLNAVVVGRTRLSAQHLMRELHKIEETHGRTREVRWGSRTLDVDLIQLGGPGEADEVRMGGPEAAAADAAQSPLALPHPRVLERAFVLAPWASVTPWARVRYGEQVRGVVEVLEELGAVGVRPGPRWADVEEFALDLGTASRKNEAAGESE